MQWGRTLPASWLLGVHGTCGENPAFIQGLPPSPCPFLSPTASQLQTFNFHFTTFPKSIPVPPLCDCIPADLWARRDHTVPSRALSIPKAATGMVPRACALGLLPCREAGGAALEGHQDFSEDESVLKCQTNFPNYLSGHFLPSALEDGGGTFHSLCAGVERGCVRSWELPAAPAAQPRFSPTSSLSHRGGCPGIIGWASPSPQPPKPLPAQLRAAKCPAKQQTPPLLPPTLGCVINRQIKENVWIFLSLRDTWHTAAGPWGQRLCRPWQIPLIPNSWGWAEQWPRGAPRIQH